MKLIAMFGAVALAAGTIVSAAPAEAQRHGYDRGGPHRGWHDRGWRGDRRGYDRRPFRGYDRGRGYGYDRGYGRGYGRGRTICRVERGYYGPVRRCFRVHR